MAYESGGYNVSPYTGLSRYLPPSPYGRMALPAFGSQYAPIAMPDPMADTSPMLPSKAELDGTNAFGHNSIAGAYDLSTMSGSSAAAPAGLFDSLSGYMKGFVGDKENPGWGGPAVGTASALTNAILGFGQMRLAKDALETNKRQFQMQYDAQKGLTNTQMQDRQRARVASNPGAYQSVGSYMNQNGIK